MPSPAIPTPLPNASAPATAPVLEVDGLRLDLLPEEGAPVNLVERLDLTLAAGEIHALVGESGCGKSVSCLALGRLNPEPPFRYGGAIRLLGRDQLTLSERELRQVRGRDLAYIFQEPGSALNPVMRVGEQIAETLRLHRAARPAGDAATSITEKVIDLLRQVGIPEPAARAKAYPHQLSGGMQQRVMIAMALACRPALLVADEPTTALDVTVQAQILELLLRLRDSHGTAMLLVTHNLGLVAGVADRVTVMYAGQMCEAATVDDLFTQPRHPYTQALLAAVPRLGGERATLATIPGRVPTPRDFPPGCRFAPRCPHAMAACRQAPPPARNAAPGHLFRCLWEASRCGASEKSP
jgi:oligopeptide/dipeptide ABC transporter ATP-binding protein